MVQPAITVDGVRELRKQLRQVKDKELDDELKAIHKGIADEIIQRALPNVPVKTGALKRSVRSSGSLNAAVGRAGRKTVPYAAPIHWGWRKRNIRARPFLTDAAEAIERDITDRYEQAITQLLERVVRGR